MAYTDVSEALLAPELTDTFTVNRRTQVVSETGRVSTSVTPIPNVVGVVCAASSNDLDRLDDNQRMGRNITIVTRTRLQGPAPNMQPDQIVWKGDTFVVKSVDPYPQYGSGFVQIIAGSIDSIDQPVP